MIIDPKYTKYALKFNEPPGGAAIPLPNKRRTNTGQIAALDEQFVSGGAGPLFGSSFSVSAEVEKLIAASGTDGALITCIHHDLQDGVEMWFGKEAAYSPDTVGTDVFIAPFPVTDYGSAGNLNPWQPLLIDNNDVLGIVGIIKQQLRKTGANVLPVTNFQPDRGNASRVIMQLAIPYTLGVPSGLAAEFVKEGAGRYETRVLIRPAGTNLPFFQIGCFDNDVTKSFNPEYSESKKGYFEETISRSIKTAIPIMEGTLMSMSEKAVALVTNSIISANSYGGLDIVRSQSNQLIEYEILIQEVSPEGLIMITRLATATFDYPATEATGGDDGYTMPVTITGHQSFERRTFPGLYQTIRWVQGVSVSP